MTRPDESESIGRWATMMPQARTLDAPAFRAWIQTALAEFELLPSGPVRSRLAENLIRLLLGRMHQGDAVALRGLDRLVRIGDEDSPDRPGWQRLRAAARLSALLRAVDERELVDYRAAMYEVDRLATEFADDPGIRMIASTVQANLALASNPNDLATMHAALAEIGELAGGHPTLAPSLELMRGLIEAFQVSDVDDGAALSSLRQLWERTQQMPDAGVARLAVETAPMLELLQSLLAGIPDTDLADHDRRLAKLRELADRPGSAATQRAFYLCLRGAAMLRQGAEQDLARLGSAITDLRTGAALTPEDHPDHVARSALLAWALSRRAEVTGTVDDLDEAITLLERGRELAAGASHPYWPTVNDLLDVLQRRRGDNRSQLRRISLEGLRGNVWQVLLQPDPIAARSAARTAAEGAVVVAGRLLADRQPADALRALDTGRGLMLFAATELRDPGARLIEAGRPDLAQRWRAGEPPPPWLRQEVLEVLSRDSGVLDPPDLEEIQAALRAVDADALVYLVPATSLWGWAVIAPVEGPPRYLPLPHLVVENETDLDRLLTEIATRDGRLMAAEEVRDIAQDDEFTDNVEELCEWAWKAAMGPVVGPYLTADRIPHLVLIPMGALARVPWQAARGPDGRYLVERAAVSQAASARMLCDTAAAEPVPLTSAGLFVADPDTACKAPDLPAARLEAYAIRESFYPSATYLGRLPNGPNGTVSGSGAGTPDEVRGWLRADGAEAGAMLHFASHGVMETAFGSASSRLLLAEGDLTADELIGVLVGSSGHVIGLVVLAACHTGRSVHGYDEAYSLATMFLAAGVRSVLSTQWSVPDRSTSLLMYMFHHYLRTERRPAWDALRRAQAWMLDGARRVPDRMPGPLRRTLGSADPARVVAWAGFVHWGQ